MDKLGKVEWTILIGIQREIKKENGHIWKKKSVINYTLGEDKKEDKKIGKSGHYPLIVIREE